MSIGAAMAMKPAKMPTPQPSITCPTVCRPSATRDQPTSTAATLTGTATIAESRGGVASQSSIAHNAAVVACALTLYRRLMNPLSTLANAMPNVARTTTGGAPATMKTPAVASIQVTPNG